MTAILAIHGIGQQMETPESLHDKWWPAMLKGVEAAGASLSQEPELKIPCYGPLFRPIGFLATGDPPFDAHDVEDWEKQLLDALWREAARVDRHVIAPDACTLVSYPKWAHELVQHALDALGNSHFWSGIAENALIFDLRQVNVYMNDLNNGKFAIRDCVVKQMSDDVRVVVAHSLGSVIAYELLCANPEWPVETLITLGSPLGMRALIFDRLEPAPTSGRGQWPGAVKTWVNIADPGDIVALEKDLRARFGDQVDNRMVDNGATAHDVTAYLRARETGGAIARALGQL